MVCYLCFFVSFVVVGFYVCGVLMKLGTLVI